MSRWEPHIDLMRLLTALGDEIAATTEGEVVRAGADARQSLTEAANEVREVISAVSGDQAGGDTDSFDPVSGLKESPIKFEGSRRRGIIAERGSRTH